MPLSNTNNSKSPRILELVLADLKPAPEFWIKKLSAQFMKIKESRKLLVINEPLTYT